GGPYLWGGEVALAPRRVADACHRVVDREFAALDGRQLDIARLIEGEHDLVDEAALLHRADAVTGAQARARLPTWHEGPLLRRVERGNRRAAHEEEAIPFSQGLQRILQSVVDSAQQPRPEGSGEHLHSQRDAA